MDRGAADVSSEPDVIGFGDNSDVDHSAADRRHGRRALVISAVALVAVFAIAGATIAYLARPKHGQVHTPTHVAGFTLDNTSDAAATASYLRTAVAAGMNLGSSVGAVYVDNSGAAHSVIFVGGTTSGGSQSTRMTNLLGMLDDGTDGIAQLTHESSGTLGGEIECAITTDSNVSDASNSEPMAACAWADADTVGLALFPNRSIAEAYGLFTTMRPVLEVR
jgi:hypothetical protein